MSGIPVLHAEGDCIARAWENALVALYESGCDIPTQYDRPGDRPSKDATMILTVHDPLAEPMIHRDLPGGFEALEEYVMEVCEGIKDHCVRDPADPSDTRWEYTYHQRLFGYQVPRLAPIDQIEHVCRQLAETPYTRRAQAITWKVWEDTTCYDPACLQSIWCRISHQAGHSQGHQRAAAAAGPVVSMNVRFRSNDAYKAAFMNIFALVQLQRRIAARVAELTRSLGRQRDQNAPATVRLGRFCHMADSFHIYGRDLPEFEGRFLGALRKRTFEQRSVRYEEVREMMEGARPAILQRAQTMGRNTR